MKKPHICWIPDTNIEIKVFNYMFEKCFKNENIRFSIILSQKIRMGTITEHFVKQIKCKTYLIEDLGVNNAYSALEILDPDVVIVNNDHTMLNRSFVVAGNFMGKKTVLLLLTGKWRSFGSKKIKIKRIINKVIFHTKDIVRRYFFLYKTMIKCDEGRLPTIIYIIKDIYKSIRDIDLVGLYNCNLIMVSGINEKKILMDKGVDNNKIVLTGSPNYDQTIEYYKKHNGKHSNFNNEKLNVGIIGVGHVGASLATQAQCNKMMENLLDILMKLEDKFLFHIKPHYTANIDVEKKSISQYNGIQLHNPKIAIEEFLINKEIIILLHYSTVGIEAMLMEKPILLYNYFNEPEYIPFCTLGGIIEINYNQEKELINTINLIANDSDYRNKLRRMQKTTLKELLYNDDGKSTERVNDEILKLLK